MATYRLKRKTFAGPGNVGFISSLFGGKNWNNISKMNAVNKSLMDAGHAAKYGFMSKAGEATKGVLKAGATLATGTALTAGGLAAGGMALNNEITKPSDD